MRELTYEESFTVAEKSYAVSIYSDGEVILSLNSTELDHMGYEIPGDIRVALTNKYNAISVYRRAVRIVKAYLYRERPYCLRFSVGSDESRIALYDRLFKMMPDNYIKVHYSGYYWAYRK